MAVESKHANTLLDANSNLIHQNLFALFGTGMNVKALFSRVEIAAADDNNSVYILWRNLPATLVPLAIMIATDGLTAGTDFNLGIFEPTKNDTVGAVIDDNCFADALDLSSAVASLNPKTALDGMKDVALDNYYKSLMEHAGDDVTTKLAGYDIGLTGIAVGSAAGGVHALMLCGSI